MNGVQKQAVKLALPNVACPGCHIGGGIRVVEWKPVQTLIAACVRCGWSGYATAEFSGTYPKVTAAVAVKEAGR
jgi:hypothetical protein